MEKRDTGIPCFECGKRSGVECPGRKNGEATRCVPCMAKYLKSQVEIAKKIKVAIKEVMLRHKDSLQKLSDEGENDGI